MVEREAMKSQGQGVADINSRQIGERNTLGSDEFSRPGCCVICPVIYDLDDELVRC
jgi:hypothetical protein